MIIQLKGKELKNLYHYKIKCDDAPYGSGVLGSSDCSLNDENGLMKYTISSRRRKAKSLTIESAATREHGTIRFVRSDGNYHEIYANGRAIHIYTLALGRVIYYPIYENDIQVGMIVRDHRNKLFFDDQYQIYLLDEVASLRDMIILYTLTRVPSQSGDGNSLPKSFGFHLNFNRRRISMLDSTWLQTHFNLEPIDVDKYVRNGVLLMIEFIVVVGLLLFGEALLGG